MTVRSHFPIIIAVVVTFVSATTSAVPVSQTICVDLTTTGFTDLTAGANDDYLRTTTAIDAQQLWLRISKVTPVPPSILWDNYLNTSGCVTVTVETTWRYEIKAFSKAKAPNNNYLEVRDNTSEQALREIVLSSLWAPPATPTTTPFPYTDNSYRTDTILAATIWTMQRQLGGVSNKTWKVINGKYASCPASCTVGNVIYLDSDGRKSKWTIAHELGHAMDNHRGGGPNEDCSLSDGGPAACDSPAGGHTYTSKERQTCAAGEGWADFWGASAYNNHAHSLCSYRGNNDCGTDTLSALEDTPCSSPWVAHGVEGDWVRVWWNVLTETDVLIPFSEIVEIYVGAGTNTWTDSNAYSRVENSASSRGYYFKFKTQAARNGVDW